MCGCLRPRPRTARHRTALCRCGGVGEGPSRWAARDDQKGMGPKGARPEGEGRSICPKEVIRRLFRHQGAHLKGPQMSLMACTDLPGTSPRRVMAACGGYACLVLSEGLWHVWPSSLGHLPAIRAPKALRETRMAYRVWVPRRRAPVSS